MWKKLNEIKLDYIQCSTYIVFVKWTPMFNESLTLDTLPMFSFHTLALNFKGDSCTLWTYGIKPQWYMATHWVFFVCKICEPMEIYNSSVFNNVHYKFKMRWINNENHVKFTHSKVRTFSHEYYVLKTHWAHK